MRKVLIVSIYLLIFTLSLLGSIFVYGKFKNRPNSLRAEAHHPKISSVDVRNSDRWNNFFEATEIASSRKLFLPPAEEIETSNGVKEIQLEITNAVQPFFVQKTAEGTILASANATHTPASGKLFLTIQVNDEWATEININSVFTNLIWALASQDYIQKYGEERYQSEVEATESQLSNQQDFIIQVSSI